MKLSYLLLIVPALALAADDPYAAAVFHKNCATCHEAGDAAGRIPQVSLLRTRTPSSILRTLESGLMKQQGAKLSANERQVVANWLGTPVILERRRDEISNACSAGAGWRNSPGWSSWSPDLGNARFQSAKDAGLSAKDIPRLQPKWAYAFPDTTVMRSQPAVYRGRIFVGAQDGSVSSLDALTGCVHWSTIVQAEVRSGMTVAEVAGKPLVFFGDSSGYYYALDGETGKQVWKLKPEDHPAIKGTATPVFYQGRVYIGISSFEEAMGVSPDYVCCTFRGSESAVDAATGKVIWKQYMIPEKAKPQSKNKRGAEVLGPSGVGVWTAPTLDAEHDALYVTTGDNYSDPPTSTSDAVVALRMSTGEILWSKQLTEKDSWNSACNVAGGRNCPDSAGPDFDFAGSSILVKLSDGRRALLLGQKSGMAYAIDPARKGEILWQARVGKGGQWGGIQWGMATDGSKVYVALSDADYHITLLPGTNVREYRLDPNKGGGLFALRMDNGERIWQTQPPSCGTRPACSPAQSSAVTGIPGAVFSGSLDGHLRAYSTENGEILWDYDTTHEFKTVNGIPGHGGAIDVAGPVVVGGMVYVMSGYALRGDEAPGNVLVAFSVEP
jgi:polyvinyl alcohol dehydrogenase (cytochrome)